MIFLRIIVCLAGLAVVTAALFSAVRTFLVPRGVTDRLTRAVFIGMRRIFGVLLWRVGANLTDRVLAYYAPTALLALPVVWLACLLGGYTAVYWALGEPTLNAAFATSRLSLFALTADVQKLPAGPIFAFSETALSVLLAAILVAYLPAIYAAFSVREVAVTGLETRAGSPPTPAAMLIRYYTIHGLDKLGEMWSLWQEWFETVEETHLALQPLVHYRSPQPDRSWITAAGSLLDSASITASTLDRPRDPEAELCIRAGYLCLRRICGAFHIPYPDDPAPTDPIMVAREEYDRVYDLLASKGVPLKSDREQCWRDFIGWRVNYDVPLVALSVMVYAPYAPWSSDRVPIDRRAFGHGDKAARQVMETVASGRFQLQAAGQKE